MLLCSLSKSLYFYFDLLFLLNIDDQKLEEHTMKYVGTYYAATILYGMSCLISQINFCVLQIFQAEFNKNICANQILQIGFGYGNLTIEGKTEGSKFVLSPKGSKSARVVSSYARLRSGFTYDWFKSEIICREKLWICIQYP